MSTATAKLRADTPFYELFDRGIVPVTSAKPHIGVLGPKAIEAEVFQIDLARLSKEKVRDVAYAIADLRDARPDEVLLSILGGAPVPLRKVWVEEACSCKLIGALHIPLEVKGGGAKP